MNHSSVVEVVCSRRTLSAAAAMFPFGSVHRQAQSQEEAEGELFVNEGHRLYALDHGRLPYAGNSGTKIRAGEGFDSLGVRLNKRNGEWHDHPLAQAQYAMMVLASYRYNGDKEYLQVALRNGERIHSLGQTVDGAVYFPYGFQMNLFGRQDMVLTPPWYSGMCQGQVLSAYLRLWDVTGSDVWRTRADEVFESFREIGAQDKPWTPTVDEYGYLWFDEYPYDPPQDVLNGLIFALFGVHEYWQLTGDSWAEELTQGVLATVKNRVHEFRVPGTTSRYSAVQDVQSDNYHVVHIAQLLTLYEISRDPAFAEAADEFAADYPPYMVKGGLSIPEGEIECFAAVSDKVELELDDPVKVRVDSSYSASVLQRRRLRSTEDYFLLVNDGPLKGYWIEESDTTRMVGPYIDKTHLHGPLEGTRRNYVYGRTISMEAGDYPAFEASGTDLLWPHITLTIPTKKDGKCFARQLVTGLEYGLIQLESAPYRYWVRITSGITFDTLEA